MEKEERTASTEATSAAPTVGGALDVAATLGVSALTAAKPEATAVVSGFTKKAPVKAKDAEAKQGELSPSVRAKIDALRRAFQVGRRNEWGQARAVAELADACEAEGRKYLEDAATHLADMGEDYVSPPRLSKLRLAYDYLRKMKVVMPKGKEEDAFPTYTQVFPLYKFVKYEKRAATMKAQWDALHSRVFGDRAKRPQAQAIQAEVSKLFAPPLPKEPSSPPPQPGIPLETIDAANVGEWLAKRATDGKLVVHKVRVARMTADALAAAIKARWETLKDSKVIEIEVGK